MKKFIAALIGAIMLLGFALPANSLIGYINSQTLMVYDGVVSGDEVEIRALFDGQEDEYQIVINTPGGSGSVCMSIVNHIRDLQESGAKITTEVSGRAASAGAVIWLTGDVRIAHRNDLIMFHSVQMINPVTGVPFPDSQLDDNDRKRIKTLNGALVEMLTPLIGVEKAKEMLKGETWLTGKEAYNMGLATILK